MQILKGHLAIKPVRSIAFSPDGTQLASSARDYKTFLWDLSTGKYQVIEPQQSYTVAFSPDGKIVATGRGDGLSLWNSATGELRRIGIDTDHGMGIAVAFSPDGELLATASGSVKFWNAATLEPLEAGPGTARATKSLAFTRDGQTLATGHSEWTAGSFSTTTLDRVVRLWDVSTRRERGALRGHTATVDALSFSPDGRFLAAATGQTLCVWDLPSGEAVVKHKISDQHYKDVAFSPDGRFLAFARNDATVRLWDTRGWNEVAAYDFQIGPMISIAFAPDSMRAAGGSGKGKIVVWDIDL
jgi:WD40 repeat protein